MSNLPDGWSVERSPHDHPDAIQINSPGDHHCVVWPAKGLPEHHLTVMLYRLGLALLAGQDLRAPDAYAVVDHNGQIEFTVMVTHEVNPSYAMELCHDHINDCAGAGVEGAGKWVVRRLTVERGNHHAD